MSSIAPLGNDVSGDVPYSLQTIKLAVEIMVEALHIQLKKALEMSGLGVRAQPNILAGVFEKTVTLMGQGEASHKLL